MFLCANDGYTVLAQVAFTVKPAPDRVPDAPASAVYIRRRWCRAWDGKLTVTEGRECQAAVLCCILGKCRRRAARLERGGDLCPHGRYHDHPAGGQHPDPGWSRPSACFCAAAGACSATGTEALLPAGAADFDPGTLLGEMQVMSDIHINPRMTTCTISTLPRRWRTSGRFPEQYGEFSSTETLLTTGRLPSMRHSIGSSRRQATDCRLFCVPSATMTLTAGWTPRGRSGASSREPETARKPSGSTLGFPATTLYFWAVRRQDCTPTCRTHSLHGWKRHWQRIASRGVPRSCSCIGG